MLLGFVGLLALGTRVQIRVAVHLWIPGALSCQCREESHELLVSEGSNVGIAAVGDVPALPFLGLPLWEDRPEQRLQDEPHFLRGLLWSVRDSVHLFHQLFRGDRFILLSEEAPWSSWDDSAAVQDPVAHFGWRGHLGRPSSYQAVAVGRGCKAVGPLVPCHS